MIIDCRDQCKKSRDEYVQLGIRTAQAVLKTFQVPRESWTNTNIGVYYNGEFVSAIFRDNKWVVTSATSYRRGECPYQIVMELSHYAENAMWTAS